MLSVLATIFFSAVLLAAAAVLISALDEARAFFSVTSSVLPAEPATRRRIAVSRPARFAQTPLRAAA